MKHLGNIIVGVCIVLGAVVVRELAAFAGMLLYGILGGVLLTDSEILLLISAFGTLVWVILFGILYKNQRKKEGIPFFTGTINGKRVFMLLVMGFGLQFLINSILGGVLKVAPNLLTSYIELIEKLGLGNSILSFVYIVLIAPIGEELVFRGVLLDYLKKHISFLTANVVQAFLFGIYHMNMVQGIYAFLLGMVLGCFCKQYGSVRESILLHMVVNLSACLLNMFLPDTAIKTGTGLFVLFIISAGMIVVSGNSFRKKGGEKQTL